MLRFFFSFLLGVGLAIGFVIGCQDKGTLEPTAAPVLNSVVPASVAVTDTIRIVGSNFGNIQGSSSVRIGGKTICSIVSWAPNEIRVRIPGGTMTDSLSVRVGGTKSNSIRVVVTGSFASQISFACDVQPIILANCAVSGCHAGSNPTSGFNQSTYAGMRAGGVNYGTNVIIPGDSTNSGIVKELRGTGIVGRMPFGGQFQATGLPNQMIVTIATWIQQGAANN